jgi:hypothetical protein
LVAGFPTTRATAVKNVADRRILRNRGTSGRREMNVRHLETTARRHEMNGHRLATTARHRAMIGRLEMNARRETNVRHETSGRHAIARTAHRMAHRLVRGPDRDRGGESSRRAPGHRHPPLFRASS